MKIDIYSRDAIEEILKQGKLNKTAVISFYDPPSIRTGISSKPVDYTGKADRLFPVCIYDIDIEVLEDYGLTYDTYFPESDELAKFIYQVKEDGYDIICQCEYGQSRSAACCAAIREHFYHDGITVFADYRYYPNQLVFNKLLISLEKQKSVCI